MMRTVCNVPWSRVERLLGLARQAGNWDITYCESPDDGYILQVALHRSDERATMWGGGQDSEGTDRDAD